jgi:hypothetical protein
MNHRTAFRTTTVEPSSAGSGIRTTYPGQFAGQTDAKIMAEQILRDLHIEGNFTSNMPRTAPASPSTAQIRSRLAASPIQPPITNSHREAGVPHAAVSGEPAPPPRLQNRYTIDTASAVSVDIAIIGIPLGRLRRVLLDGMKLTRRIGAICIAAGLSLFAFFTFTL